MYSLTFRYFCVIMEALLRGYVMNKIKNIIIRRILPTSIALSMAGFGGLPSHALSKDALPSYSYIESAFDTDELTKEEELAQVVVDYIQNKYPLEDDINSKANDLIQFLSVREKEMQTMTTSLIQFLSLQKNRTIRYHQLKANDTTGYLISGRGAVTDIDRIICMEHYESPVLNFQSDCISLATNSNLEHTLEYSYESDLNHCSRILSLTLRNPYQDPGFFQVSYNLTTGEVSIGDLYDDNNRKIYTLDEEQQLPYIKQLLDDYDHLTDRNDLLAEVNTYAMVLKDSKTKTK